MVYPGPAVLDENYALLQNYVGLLQMCEFS